MSILGIVLRDCSVLHVTVTCAHVCVIYNTMQSNQCLACNFVAESYALISRAQHDVQQRDKSNILCLYLCRRTLLLYCDGGKCGMGAGANDDQRNG